MIRPGPSGDEEFEEVALRMAEAGALSDLIDQWEDSPTDDHEKERVPIVAIYERVSGVLGRRVEPVEQNADQVSFSNSASWWQAAYERRRDR